MKILQKLLFLLLFIAVNKLFAQEEIQVSQWTPPGVGEVSFISSPTVSFDGKYMAFVIKTNDNSTKVYESINKDGQWQDAKEIKTGKTEVNSVAYNYDASKLYFTASNGSNYDVYFMERTKDAWSNPVALGNAINTPADEVDVSISADDKTLYFVRLETDEEYGTIYFSQKDKKGNWQKAIAIPNPISIGYERSPRILIDNETLIFASKRDKDKSFKIYYTKNLFGEFWKMPVYLGVYDDKNDMFYPVYNPNDKKLYYASQKNSSKSLINTADYPSKYKPGKVIRITGKITDKKNKPVKGQIYLLNPVSMEVEGRYANNLDGGSYAFYVMPDNDYVIDYTASGYSHFFYDFNSEKIDKQNLNVDVKLFDSVYLQLNVFDRDIYEPLDVDMEIKDKKNGEKINFVEQKKQKGKYLLRLPLGKDMDIHLSGFYLRDSVVNVDFSGVVLFENFEKNIDLVSEKVPFEFNVLDKQTGAGVECEVVLVDKKTKKKIVTKVKTDKNGRVKIFLRKGGEYDVTISPQGYAFYSSQLDLNKGERSKRVELQPLKKDVTIELPNINFELNSAELKVESYKELDKVIELMNKNPQIKVEISAHTDDLGSEAYNMKLSERRAKSVVDYLLMHDIPQDRLIAKGYGETKPLVPNTSDENRAKNRRVELKIIDVNQ